MMSRLSSETDARSRRCTAGCHSFPCSSITLTSFEATVRRVYNAATMSSSAFPFKVCVSPIRRLRGCFGSRFHFVLSRLRLCSSFFMYSSGQCALCHRTMYKHEGDKGDINKLTTKGGEEETKRTLPNQTKQENKSHSREVTQKREHKPYLSEGQ